MKNKTPNSFVVLEVGQGVVEEGLISFGFCRVLDIIGVYVVRRGLHCCVQVEGEYAGSC